MAVRANANGEQLEIHIDGKSFYRGPVRKPDGSQSAAE
jgi:hypothetical protein